MSTNHPIIILGGGFAGIACAKKLLSKRRGTSTEILLFSLENHMVFAPLLAEVVGATVEPTAIASPLREILFGVYCRTEEVLQIDLKHSSILIQTPEKRLENMTYDQLVIACGSVVNMAIVPGMADHSFPLRTVGDALTLRAHVMQQLERAEVCRDPVKKQWYMKFIVVGGGFSGVEVAGEINDLIKSSLKLYPHIEPKELKVTLVQSGDSILPEVTPHLQDFAKLKMEKHGIHFEMNSRVSMATPEGVFLNDGRMLLGGTVVCTIGNSPSPLVEKLETEKKGGRIVTETDMRLKNAANAWAIGDCAYIMNAATGMPSSPTGQFAERQGKQVAENIWAKRMGENTKPFTFKPIGQLCAIGGHSAVADIMGVRLSGFFAWWLWRTVYLLKHPSFSRRAKLALDWTWELLFSRDLVHLKTNTTNRVSRAFYRAGDTICRVGDPGHEFFIIEKGEVEILHQCENQTETRVVAHLHEGDYFGEIALMDNTVRQATVRARTHVQVLVVGKKVFEDLSESLKPLKKLLSESLVQRKKSLKSPGPFKEKLASLLVKDVMEPLTQGPVSNQAEVQTIIRLFYDQSLDLCCVQNDQGMLVGVITRTDLLKVFGNMMEACETRSGDWKAENIMQPSPSYAALDETCLNAYNTMAERRVSKLPVVNNRNQGMLKGYLRLERMLGRVSEFE